MKLKGKGRKKNGFVWNRSRVEGVLSVMTLWLPLQFIFLIFIKIQDPLFYWIVLQNACILIENRNVWIIPTLFFFGTKYICIIKIVTSHLNVWCGLKNLNYFLFLSSVLCWDIEGKYKFLCQITGQSSFDSFLQHYKLCHAKNVAII